MGPGPFWKVCKKPMPTRRGPLDNLKKKEKAPYGYHPCMLNASRYIQRQPTDGAVQMQNMEIKPIELWVWVLMIK